MLFMSGLVLCACSDVFAYAQQAIDVSGLSENQVATMDVSKPDRAGKTFIAATIINAPMQKLCSIILDYPNYPNFMPNTDKTKVVQATDEFSVVDMTLKLPLGKIKRYRLKLEPKTSAQSCHLAWKLIPWDELKPDETIADTSGYWQLTPQASNPNKTVVEYFVYADPGPVPFGLGWIVDIMSKFSLPKTLEAVRNRARTN
jgi:hypothetical protein